MKKRFLSLVLLLAITCTLCLSANASASSTENSVASLDNIGPYSYEYRVSNGNAQTGNVKGFTLSEMKVDDESYIYTASVSDDLFQTAYSVPDEILNGNTKDLLEWFLNCDYVQIKVSGLFLSAPRVEPVSFFRHPAYQELITRADLITSIRDFATENIENAIELHDEISALLQQPEVKAFVGDAAAKTIDIFGDLNTKQSAETYSTQSSEYAFTINNIDYYYTGKTITSANGNSAKSYVAERDLNSNEITAFNNTANAYGVTVLSAPNSKYNCHSFAWYKSSSHLNTSWIDSEGMLSFMADSYCSVISESQLQEKDIVVYIRRLGNGSYYPLHSGYIYSKSGSQITICSKWGQGCVSLHEINNVPEDYCDYTTEGDPFVHCIFYRYHDFAARYTGNNYHSKGMHYLEYIDTCAVCGLTQGSAFWTSAPCSGPPCNTPLSQPDDEVAA